MSKVKLAWPTDSERGIMHTLLQQTFDLGTAEEAKGRVIRGDR